MTLLDVVSAHRRNPYMTKKTTFTRDRTHAPSGIRTHNPSMQAATGIGFCACTTPKFMTVLYETCHWILLYSTLLRFTHLFGILLLYLTYQNLSLLLVLLGLLHY